MQQRGKYYFWPYDYEYFYWSLNLGLPTFIDPRFVWVKLFMCVSGVICVSGVMCFSGVICSIGDYQDIRFMGRLLLYPFNFSCLMLSNFASCRLPFGGF